MMDITKNGQGTVRTWGRSIPSWKSILRKDSLAEICKTSLKTRRFIDMQKNTCIMQVRAEPIKIGSAL